MPVTGRTQFRLPVAFAWLTLCGTSLHAQGTSGVGDDAIPIAKGGYRFGIAANWNSTDDVFRKESGGGLQRRPLLAGLNVASFGVSQLPQLAAAEQGIRSLSGLSNFSVSLGKLEATGSARETIVPMSIEYGVTRRISVKLLVPYVEARTTTRFVLNREGTGATVGQNPAYLASGTVARATNGGVLRQINDASLALAGEIQRCGSATATGCDAIRANAARAQALLAQALASQQSIAAIYGDSVNRGSLIAPIAGSTVQAAIIENIATLRSGFSEFGINSISDNLAPVAATTVIGPAGIARIAADTALGLGYNALGNTRRAGIGDIDFTASVVIFDTFGNDPNARFTPSGVNLRSAVSGGWRFGSGNADRTNNPFDIGTGEGTSALLARSTTDLILGRRFWVSGTLRLIKPLSDEVAIAFPFQDESNVFEPFTVITATRELGTRMQLEIAPRASIGQYFGVSAAWQFARRGEDKLTPTDASKGATTMEAQSLHSLAVGVSYSSLASYARGRSRLPLEVFYIHSEPLAASGNLVPATATDRLQFRLYLGMPRDR